MLDFVVDIAPPVCDDEGTPTNRKAHDMTITEEILTTNQIKADLAEQELGRREYNKNSKKAAFRIGETVWARIECPHEWLFKLGKPELEALVSARWDDDPTLDGCESCGDDLPLSWSNLLCGEVCDGCKEEAAEAAAEVKDYEKVERDHQ